MYELVLVLDTSVSEDSRKKLFEKIEKNIKESGRTENTTDMGKKMLVYPIKKKQDGHFWLLTLSMSGKEAASLTAKLKLEESILRMLLVKKDIYTKKT